MSDTKNIRPRASSGRRSFGRYAVAVLWLALAVSCGDSAPVAPPGTGTGGSGGTGGMAGSVGSGGMAGSVGSGGTAGSVGSGGMAGTGGTAGSGAAGGSGGSNGLCTIDEFPDQNLCDTDADCTGPLLSGHVCVASGCEAPGGSPIKQCVPSWAPSCSSPADCRDEGAPDEGKYDCVQVGFGSKHCVRVADGCDVGTESLDCAPGFSCEGGTCVDRRIPCGSSFDCPKSHVCQTTPVAKYCVRAHRTCAVPADCTWRGVSVGAFCADVDVDGRMECVGELDSPPFGACVNSACGGSVCESAGVVATCGDYGLCLVDNDCGTGFSCVGLWRDGRKECVQTPLVNNCEQVTDCPLPQVCAAPRTDGRPSCQAGSAP